MITYTIKNLISDKSRSSVYIKNIVLSSVFQITNLWISFLLVPLTLEYLGVEKFGVWVTLANFVAWFTVFDMGVGLGFRNKYAEAKARKDELDMKKYVSTTFFCLTAISITMLIVFIAVSYFINWTQVLNAPSMMASELNLLALILITMFCFRFILSIINSLLTADQDPSTPILLNGLGNLLSLFLVYFIIKNTESSLLYIGVALTCSQIFPLLCAFIFLFSTKYRVVKPSFKFFSRNHVRAVFSLGTRFFLIQLAALVVVQGNNMIIAHSCGLKEVSNFDIAYKYISILNILLTASLLPLWSATTDAYIKGDIPWIKKSMRKLNQLWILILFAGMVLVLVSPFTYRIWLKDVIEPDYMLLTLILMYYLFLSKSQIYASIMNGTGKVTLQFYVKLTQSFVHVPLAYILGRYYGVYGVLSVMILWPLLNCIWEKKQFVWILDNKAKGIWNK